MIRFQQEECRAYEQKADRSFSHGHTGTALAFGTKVQESHPFGVLKGAMYDPSERAVCVYPCPPCQIVRFKTRSRSDHPQNLFVIHPGNIYNTFRQLLTFIYPSTRVQLSL